MITVEECLLFAEWVAHRYYKTPSGKWFSNDINDPQKYTTRELWDQYQQFLGKKG